MKSLNAYSNYLLIFLIINNYYIKCITVNAVIEEGAAKLSSAATSLAALPNNANNATTIAQSVVNASELPQPPQPAARSPARFLKLNKCCHFGEYLDKTQACVAGSSEIWAPRIYLVRNNTFYEPGKIPKYMRFEENVQPIMDINDEMITTNQTQQKEMQGCTADDLQMFTGSQIVLFSNGSLYLTERSISIEARRYCVDRDAALVCFPSKKSLPTLGLHKCCGVHGTYDANAKKCVFGATLNNNNNGGNKLRISIEEHHYQKFYGFPKCQDNSTVYAMAGDWKDAQLNNKTGDLQLRSKNFTALEYCIEHLLVGNITTASAKVFVCLHHFAPQDPLAASTTHSQVVVLNIGVVISVIFLGATLVASYLTPSVHHVLHWRCQIYYVFCLFVGDLMLAYTQLSHSWEDESAACHWLASAMHFFFLSAFFWLNTMCFNIWWTFRDFRPSSLERNQELLRLRLYSAYAWGIPLLISIIAATLDQVENTELLRPGFGVRSCWFSGDHLSIFAYFFGPIGVLLCANIMLFVSTTHQLTCGLWKRDDVKSTTEKTALGKVCLKLVVVMGVTWIADVISWLVGGPDSLWIFTDLINALQGVFIFIVIGCQPQVWAACKRYCCPRSRQEITNTTNGVQHSSSSHGLPSMGACGAETTQNTSVNTTIVNSPNSHAKIPMETMC